MESQVKTETDASKAAAFHFRRYGEWHLVSPAESSHCKPIGQKPRIRLVTLVSILIPPLKFWAHFWPFLGLFLSFTKEIVIL